MWLWYARLSYTLLLLAPNAFVLGYHASDQAVSILTIIMSILVTLVWLAMLFLKPDQPIAPFYYDIEDKHHGILDRQGDATLDRVDALESAGAVEELHAVTQGPRGRT